MKTIDTLVDDIYGLFTSGSVDKGGFQKFLSAPEPSAAAKVGNQLRMSSIGTPCTRKLWYSINEPKSGEALEAPQLIKFTFGDILESFLLQLAVMAGHTVEGTQDELVLNGVTGHRDAIIDGELVDVKSASTYSFKKFKEGLKPAEDAFGYLVQQNLYLESSKDDPRLKRKDRFHFLVVDKTLGNLCLDTHQKDPRDWVSFVENRKKIAEGKAPPQRGFSDVPEGKSGNMKLGIECSYCQFKTSCWPQMRTFIYSTGPTFLTKVVRTPNVAEVSPSRF